MGTLQEEQVATEKAGGEVAGPSATMLGVRAGRGAGTAIGAAPAQQTAVRSAAVTTPPAPAGRPFHRWWLAAGLALLVVIAGGVVWWNGSRTPTIGYTAMPVTRGTVARTVTATGTVNPVLTIIVGSYVSGVIQALYCDYNSRVKQGQICAKIDPRPYQTVVDQDRANLETAKAQLGKDHANLTYAKLTYERNVSMQQSGVVTQDALDNAKSAHDQALAQIAVDSATIDQRQAELQSAEINLGYTDIISPVNGTVVSRNVTMGQTVAASFQTPTLFLIATDLTKMQVDGNISESDIGGIKNGNPSTFTVEAFPSHPFSGTVTQVRQSPQTVQNVVTYDVVVSVANPDLLLKPGMTATTKIVTARRDNVILVPDQALRYVPGGLATVAPSEVAEGEAASGAHVWALRAGRPVRIAITPGLDDDTYTEVVGGDLKAGDQVIVSEHSGAAKGGTSAVRPPVL